jgi:hypothetical protein
MIGLSVRSGFRPKNWDLSSVYSLGNVIDIFVKMLRVPIPMSRDEVFLDGGFEREAEHYILMR